ncbi:hypothetical protein V2S66_18465 [Streptomyces sp. V4-01]|uniref:Uncharacterized protein n=1 Tax=Actinacidiphila polyblastidii TaxID=3110430 RepID=A0ABU7PDQ9_9ACTN|nr:hypothetical protein [Streptomyces sp. V4-01]
MSASEGRWKRLIASAISLGAVGVGVVHVVKPELKIDGATLALAAIAVIPWLDHLFESIELPGGTKLQYRHLEERVEAAEQQAQEVRLAVDDASRQARVALVTSGSDGLTGEATELVEQLVHEFTSLRRNEAPSSARTYRQERIFTELIRLTPQLTEFDTEAVLTSPDGGTRLTAYARLYARPEPRHLPALVNAAIQESMAFNQYWAFHAVGAVIDALGADNVQLGTIRRLSSYLPQLRQGSDRSRALRAVLGRVERAG